MKRLAFILFLILAVTGFSSGLARADVKLPAVIGSGMVLQRDRPAAVWGWATPGEKVTVTFAGRTCSARANQAGRWQVALPKLAASVQPRPMLVEGTGGSRVELMDILVGDVWFCTGPSNIFWPVRKCNDAEQEIRQAESPQIRFFTVEKKTADEPQQDCTGHWFGCNPRTVGNVSGIGYFFSRRIHQELDVPIGLIQSFWGGSRIEAWTSREALQAEPAVKPILEWWQEKLQSFDPAAAQALREKQLEAWKKARAQARSQRTRPPKRPAAREDPRTSRHRPACLYNGMVAPLVPFSIRGVICYQGLGNLFWADRNAALLELMIRDWRGRWGQGDFPVGMVQPAPYDCSGWSRSNPDAYSVQREAQLLVHAKVANTGIALTMDVDAVNVLHFPNKQIVGQRLANWALAAVYGLKAPYAGPLYESMNVEGKAIRLHFCHTGTGLTTNDGRPPAHFEIAGADGTYHPAKARIDGHTVIVSSASVAKPVAARFAFSDTAVVNLTNSDGLPASLFRTDHTVQSRE